MKSKQNGLNGHICNGKNGHIAVAVKINGHSNPMKNGYHNNNIQQQHDDDDHHHHEPKEVCLLCIYVVLVKTSSLPFIVTCSTGLFLFNHMSKVEKVINNKAGITVLALVSDSNSKTTTKVWFPPF